MLHFKTESTAHFWMGTSYSVPSIIQYNRQSIVLYNTDTSLQRLQFSGSCIVTASIIPYTLITDTLYLITDSYTLIKYSYTLITETLIPY